MAPDAPAHAAHLRGRLTIAFVAVIALTLGLVSMLVLNRLDDYFAAQQIVDLKERSTTVSGFIQSSARSAAGRAPIVGADGRVDERVVEAFSDPTRRAFITDRLGQADVIVRFGLTMNDGGQPVFVPAPNGTFPMTLQAPPRAGQSRENTFVTE